MHLSTCVLFSVSVQNTSKCETITAVLVCSTRDTHNIDLIVFVDVYSEWDWLSVWPGMAWYGLVCLLVFQ